jgi:hypothetical protein
MDKQGRAENQEELQEHSLPSTNIGAGTMNLSARGTEQFSAQRNNKERRLSIKLAPSHCGQLHIQFETRRMRRAILDAISAALQGECATSHSDGSAGG